MVLGECGVTKSSFSQGQDVTSGHIFRHIPLLSPIGQRSATIVPPAGDVEDIEELVAEHRSEMVPGEDRLARR